jgi:hypothetical protein
MDDFGGMISFVHKDNSLEKAVAIVSSVSSIYFGRVFGRCGKLSRDTQQA